MKFESKLRDDGATEVSIAGEFDSLTTPQVRAAFDELAATKPDRVVLELSQLRLIDSSGVGAIVALYKRVVAAGGTFEVTGIQGQPKSIFKVLRLDRVFNLAT